MDDKELKEKVEPNLEGNLFDHAKNMDADQQYWFKLRGESINLLIDAATPLLGMALRVKKLTELETVSQLYQQTLEDIIAIETELVAVGYEHAIVLAYRYLLCCFIDEAVMSTGWGSESVWAEHSLLTRFHNETWGGEKVFTILQRLESEPHKYKDLLEFIFLCFSLGFEGRYKVMANGREEYDKIYTELYETIRRLKDEEPEQLTSATDHVVNTKYKIGHQLPLWTIFAGFFCMLSVIFTFYSVSLNQKSSGVLNQLFQILK
ncbi:type IVB secretion system protein IcmH/DotU [Shewanella surugensis]|uniref:Type IVB secretion system protein IcmH/DotU n=1 Tax=Shewanella surugensis TaxID=212020 RepID=A0ABT0LCX0_9GAMM|nr:type IVB secretion system protein IcmH/DotU [Shewanella surugensis]MCL1125542.1 type IVB secretion system protein IcmH/DotU [Shewanella surugensis]